MDNKEALLANLDKIHTTEMGINRIKKNLNLTVDDVVLWCKERVASDECQITRRGKNWYAETGNFIITINAYSYTIITSHKSKK